VPDDRATFAYFRRRCWSEGISKAVVASAAGERAALSTERRYVASTLARAVARDLGRATRGDLAALGRAAAIVVGTCCAAAGYLTQRRRTRAWA
jgi:hypothetical protein